MYMPKLYQEDDLATLHGLMRDYSFATLVTQHDGAPFATHLPLVLAADEGPYGTLYGHIARANPQWQDFDETQEVLVIFQGPHTYVSPSWYEVELSVPTWNYTAVHAYGTPHLVTDYDAFYALLDTLVRTHESQFARPWLIPVTRGLRAQDDAGHRGLYHPYHAPGRQVEIESKSFRHGPAERGCDLAAEP